MITYKVEGSVAKEDAEVLPALRIVGIERRGELIADRVLAVLAVRYCIRIAQRCHG